MLHNKIFFGVLSLLLMTFCSNPSKKAESTKDENENNKNEIILLKIEYQNKINKIKIKNNEIIIKDNLKKLRIYDDETLENIKKYYKIEENTDLFKFIKLNGIVDHE